MLKKHFVSDITESEFVAANSAYFDRNSGTQQSMC